MNDLTNQIFRVYLNFWKFISINKRKRKDWIYSKQARMQITNPTTVQSVMTLMSWTVWQKAHRTSFRSCSSHMKTCSQSRSQLTCICHIVLSRRSSHGWISSKHESRYWCEVPTPVTSQHPSRVVLRSTLHRASSRQWRSPETQWKQMGKTQRSVPGLFFKVTWTFRSSIFQTKKQFNSLKT